MAEEEKRILVNENKREIRINDDRIEDLAKRISDKLGVQKDKVETELKMGVVMGIMMNRHYSQQKNYKIRQ